MPKALTSALAITLLSLNQPVHAADTAAEIHSDVQLRAMSDELARAKTLQLNNLDKPYFIQFTEGDSEQAHIAASLGGILSSSRMRFRAPRLDVRVGDYKFDNTNSLFSEVPRFGRLPIDDDYQALRTEFWLGADGLYKAAADEITRKRNALREIADPDQTPDLAPARPVQFIQPPVKLDFDLHHWEEILRQASGRLTAFPAVTESNIQLRAIVSTYRLVNSEGTVIRIPQELSDIGIRAAALAADGSHVWNFQSFTFAHPADFFSPDALDKAVDAIATQTDALTKAPIADDYSGPVLFEQEAAAQMMASVLTDAIRLHRKPVAPPGANVPEVLESVWASRIGSKVVPEWLTIVDDPTQSEFNGTPLAGAYPVDDEGVPAERVLLVDKGALKGFLASREPVRDFNASNGHGRLPGGFGSEVAVIGNLFLQAAKTDHEADMKRKLIDHVKDSGLKFGILIRRLDFPSTASFDELQSIARQLQKGGYSRTLNAPLLAYRVYLDGREELVRGLRFRDFSAKDLRDVALASDHPYVLNYVNNGSSFNYADSTNDATTSSVICPSLLFDAIDLARSDSEPGKLPIVPAPTLTAQR
jgi:TldD protein